LFSGQFPLFSDRAIPPQFVDNISLPFSSLDGATDLFDEDIEDPALCFGRCLSVDLPELLENAAEILLTCPP
jgi:hypothetical protein